LPLTLRFSDPDKIRDMQRRFGSVIAEDLAAMEYGIRQGRGGVWLMLDRKQYQRLGTQFWFAERGTLINGFGTRLPTRWLWGISADPNLIQYLLRPKSWSLTTLVVLSSIQLAKGERQ